MKLGIIGAGSWGSALAMILASRAESVVLYARDEAVVLSLNQTGAHPYFSQFKRPINLIATCKANDLAQSDIILSVIPAQNTRAFLQENTLPSVPFVLCSKGIECQTGLFLSDMVRDVAPHLIAAALSGPSFAEDAMRGLPTAVTLASSHEGTAKIIAQSLMTASFRLYHTSDIRGVEIGGAAKNVLAIAAGIVAGKQLGASALAALISRGFAELMRFGESYGAESATLTGLSGLGDLILSANSPQSRNFSFGYALGKGEPPPLKLAEGVFTASILVRLAREKNIDMPICEAVNAVLSHIITPDEAIMKLLSRPQKSEK